ncbi:hypothetical protein D7V82_22425 [bacterium 1xD8-6]|nr:hypothetical protein D7V72_22645 [bacterium D16-36]RKI60956.1 hypothetical protein D7V82_22425 [bacterium 1xD8-6]
MGRLGAYELQSMVQIIELYGRGLGALGRAIRFSAKGAAKGVDVAKVKTMQCKMKLHYASTGNRKTMKLSDLEKLTGGQYNILNIPLENEKALLGFYDRLKKMRVSFAELPDLQLGDGYTQIAYNPMDAENVKMVVGYYRKHLSEMPKDISVDQYMDMAGKDGQELLNELAEKGYTDGMHIEQLSEIQERIRDDNYIPISLNMKTLLLQENKDSYVLKIPKSRLNAALEHAIVVPKKDCLLLDQGQTLVTCLDRQGKTKLYHMDAHGHVVEENPLNMKNEDLGKAFVPLSRQKIQQIGRLKPEQADIFPSFNQGQENRTDSSAPDSVPEPDIAGDNLQEKTETLQNIPTLSEGQEKMVQILSAEQLKGYQSGEEYIPLSFDVETEILTDSPNIYVVVLPGMPEDGKNHLRCAIVNKSDTKLSEDGKSVTAYLKRDGESVVMVFNEREEKIREYKQKNEEMAAICLKQQRERSGKGMASELKQLQEVAKSMPEKVVSGKGTAAKAGIFR